MTLIECLLSLAISAILLTGMTHMLGVGLASNDLSEAKQENLAQARIMMRRIAWFVAAASVKKATSKTDDTTSGAWLDTYDPVVKQKVTFSYTWDGKHLIERDNSGLERYIKNVTGFSIREAKWSTESASLVDVSLTIGSGEEAVTISETLRLGGVW